MKRNRDPPWYVVDWVSTRSQAWLAREWLQIPSWLSCQSLTRFFAHRSHYSAIPACKPYYVLHGISALEVAVVVLYLSRYQHHDENLAGKLSQSWSEKSSGSTRKRMDDAFKSLWSVALELELILALILMQFFSVQQHKRKRSSVAKLKEKKGFLVEESRLCCCFWSHQRNSFVIRRAIKLFNPFAVARVCFQFVRGFFATQQQHYYHLL